MTSAKKLVLMITSLAITSSAHSAWFSKFCKDGFSVLAGKAKPALEYTLDPSSSYSVAYYNLAAKDAGKAAAKITEEFADYISPTRSGLVEQILKKGKEIGAVVSARAVPSEQMITFRFELPDPKGRSVRAIGEPIKGGGKEIELPTYDLRIRKDGSITIFQANSFANEKDGILFASDHLSHGLGVNITFGKKTGEGIIIEMPMGSLLDSEKGRSLLEFVRELIGSTYPDQQFWLRQRDGLYRYSTAGQHWVGF